MKKHFILRNTCAIIVALLMFVPNIGCKSTVPDDLDLSKAYANINRLDEDKVVDFDQLTIADKQFSVWSTRSQIETKLSTNFARTCGSELIGGSSDGTYVFLGCDCNYEGISREKYKALGQVKLGKEFQTGTNLTDLLSSIPSIVATSTDALGYTHYSVMVANKIIVKPENYRSYLTAITQKMLFPNCTFSLQKMQQELFNDTNDRQQLYQTARFALMSDIVNDNLSGLLEISFVVNTKGVVTEIEVSLYKKATSLL